MSSWSDWNTPLKHSQVSLDGFDQWKKEQQKIVSDRGADANPSKEDEYNQFMLRQNLNAYVCYNELDDYTRCLKANHLLNYEEDEQSGSRVEINVKNKANEKLCRKGHTAYLTCMSSKRNQEAIMQNAVMQPNCTENREELLRCMAEHSEHEVRRNDPQCLPLYRSLLRCGLNHDWNHYWRSITKFGDADEYHLYELSKDDKKKQEFMRLATSTAKGKADYRKYQENLKEGYFLKREEP